MNENLNAQIDAFGSRIGNILSNIDLRPILPTIQQIVDNSIQKNFNEGGRFGSGRLGGGTNKWKPSKRDQKEKKINSSYGKTLIDTAQLVQSIRVSVTQSGSKIIIQAGSNKVYAAIHNFGGKTRGSTEMPKRPYIVLQDEDVQQIISVVASHLAKLFL